MPERIDAQCSNCNSLERHRLFFLNLDKKIINNENEGIKEPILHFAAEEVLENYFRDKYKNYKTADLQVTPDFIFSKKSDIQLNIENIEVPDNTFNTIIANHVLEHVLEHFSCEHESSAKQVQIFFSKITNLRNKVRFQNK